MKIKASSQVMSVLNDNPELWKKLNRLGEAVNILEFCLQDSAIEPWGYAGPDKFAAELLQEVEKFICHTEYSVIADNASFVLNLMGWCDVTPYIVNVWLSPDPTAQVSEEFETIEEAIAFRDSYANDDEANAVIFYGNCQVTGDRLEVVVY